MNEIKDLNKKRFCIRLHNKALRLNGMKRGFDLTQAIKIRKNELKYLLKINAEVMLFTLERLSLN